MRLFCLGSGTRAYGLSHEPCQESSSHELETHQYPMSVLHAKIWCRDLDCEGLRVRIRSIGGDRQYSCKSYGILLHWGDGPALRACTPPRASHLLLVQVHLPYGRRSEEVGSYGSQSRTLPLGIGCRGAEAALTLIG